MVPSDPLSSLPSSRARSLSVASGSPGRLSLRSAQRILPRRASSLQATPASPPDRSQRLATAFHSPVTAVPARDHRGGISTPGLSLQRPAGSSACPFGLWAPFPTRQSFPTGLRSAPSARCRLPVPAAAKPSRTSAPPRGLTPLGSLRSARFSSAELTSPKSPVSLRSPPAQLFMTCASRSPFRVRYFS